MSAEAVEDASEAPTLSKQPWNTLRLFAKYMGNIIFASIQKAALNPLTTCLVYPAIACYVVLKVMGLFPAFIREAEVRPRSSCIRVYVCIGGKLPCVEVGLAVFCCRCQLLGIAASLHRRVRLVFRQLRRFSRGTYVELCVSE